HDGFLFQTKEPVQKMADLKGMKLRAASRGGVWLLEALGATGIGLPLPRIPEALSKGVIDGVTLPYEIAPAVKTPDLVSHFSSLAGSQPRLGTNVFTFLMNKASYDKLPADLKKVLDDNSGRAIAAAAGQNWRDIETPGRKVVESKSKNKFYVIPADEVEKMKAAAQPVFDRWYEEVGKRGLDGPTMVIDALDLIEKHSGSS
ncbi:MAG: C4-dicarboxylate ABC transporter substrate-binding protein, partial [Rhodospirillaceae bacterium]